MTERTVTKEDAEAALSGLCWTASDPSNFNKSSVATDRVRTIRTYLTSLESQLAEARLAARKEFAEEIVREVEILKEYGAELVDLDWDYLCTLAPTPKE